MQIFIFTLRLQEYAARSIFLQEIDRIAQGVSGETLFNDLGRLHSRGTRSMSTYHAGIL